MRQVAPGVGDRIDDVLAIGFQGDREIAGPHGFQPRPGGHDFLCDGDADLAELIDQPRADDHVRLIDVTIEHFERQTFGAGFF